MSSPKRIAGLLVTLFAVALFGLAQARAGGIDPLLRSQVRKLLIDFELLDSAGEPIGGGGAIDGTEGEWTVDASGDLVPTTTDNAVVIGNETSAGGSRIMRESTYLTIRTGDGGGTDDLRVSSLGVNTTPPASGSVSCSTILVTSNTGSQIRRLHMIDANDSLVNSITGGRVDLTDNTATTVATVALAASARCGGTITYTIEVEDNLGDFQSLSGQVQFAAVNKAGTYTTSITEDAVQGSALSAGTLADTWTITTGTNLINIQLNANSSLLTFATFRVQVQVQECTGAVVTIQ
jgi:hypothetical protein